MKCEFVNCIYNKDSACIFDEIEINSLAMCDYCEIGNVPEGDLEEYKNKRFERHPHE